MTTVENIENLPHVRIGFGTIGQEAALRTAGAERVFIHPDDTASVLDLAGITVRAGDTLLMVQPGLLGVAEYDILHKACDGELLFQVVGHDPLPLRSKKHFTEFRRIKPRGMTSTATDESVGRPRTVATYSIEQADAIINIWHTTPKYSHEEISQKTKEILKLPADADLKSTWVRDLVKKYVGTAQRERPRGWRGLVDD